MRGRERTGVSLRSLDFGAVPGDRPTGYGYSAQASGIQPPAESVLPSPILSTAGSSRWIKAVARITPDPKNLPNSKTDPGTAFRSRRVRFVMTGKRVPTRDVTRMTKMEPTWESALSLFGGQLTRNPRWSVSFGPQLPSARVVSRMV
jgi:hypothetical protein